MSRLHRVSVLLGIMGALDRLDRLAVKLVMQSQSRTKPLS